MSHNKERPDNYPAFPLAAQGGMGMREYIATHFMGHLIARKHVLPHSGERMAKRALRYADDLMRESGKE